ncbi:flagellar basal body P-ring formation chaperone FlgA [Bordetella sp. 2513F-2]
MKAHLIPIARAACALALACMGASAAAAGAAPAQDPGQLARSVVLYLESRLADIPGKATITVDPVRTERLPACEALEPFLPSALRLRARMSVGVRCTAPQAWTTYVQASLSIAGEYYVAARRIAPGRVIEAADLEARAADLVALPPGVITDPAQAVGMRAAYRIAAGQPLKGSALRSAQSVERGQNVRIVANGKGFVVTGEGEVLADAAPGARVQVRTASGQIVSGIVQNAGLVEIPL